MLMEDAGRKGPGRVYMGEFTDILKNILQNIINGSFNR